MKFRLIALILLLAPGAFGAQQVVNIGTTANDGTGDTLRTAFSKINSNETYLFGVVGTSLLSGTNTWTGTNNFTNGPLLWNGIPVLTNPAAFLAPSATNGFVGSGITNGLLGNGTFVAATNQYGSASFSNSISFDPSPEHYTVSDVERGRSYLFRPPFGYNTWGEYSSGITETILTNAVQTIKTNGLLAWCKTNGIPFVFSIDDYFIQGADPVTLLPTCNPATFPDGVSFMLNYIYTNGMIPGVYITPGHTNPIFANASEGCLIPGKNEEIVAAFLVTNHVSYVKYDGWQGSVTGFGTVSNFMNLAVTNVYSSARFMQAMRAYSPGPVFFNAPVQKDGTLGGYFVNGWRTFGVGTDIDNQTFTADAAYGSSALAAIAQFFWIDAATNATYSSWTGPWHMVDFDNAGGFVDQENLTRMIIRSIFGSAIILGDVRTNGWLGVSDDYRIYTNNPNLLAIDWDSGYVPPFWAGTNNGCYFYVRPLGSVNSSYKAAAVINRNYTMPNSSTYTWYPTNTTFPLSSAGYSPTQLVLVRNAGGQVSSDHGIGTYAGSPAYGYILVTNSVSIPLLDAIDSAMLILTPTNALPLPYPSNVISLVDWPAFWVTNLSPNGLQQLEAYQPFSKPGNGIGSNNVACGQVLQILGTNWFGEWGIYGATNFSATIGYDTADSTGFNLTNYSRWIILVDGVTNYDSQNWGPIGVTNQATNISLALSGTAQIMTIRYLTAGANFSVGDLGNPLLTFVPPLINATISGSNVVGSVAGNAQLGAANTFTGSNTFSGVVTLTNTVQGNAGSLQTNIWVSGKLYTNTYGAPIQVTAYVQMIDPNGMTGNVLFNIEQPGYSTNGVSLSRGTTTSVNFTNTAPLIDVVPIGQQFFFTNRSDASGICNIVGIGKILIN